MADNEITIPGTETRVPMWVVLLAGVVVILVVVFKPKDTTGETDNPDLAGVPSGLILSEVNRLLEQNRLNLLGVIQAAMEQSQGTTPPNETIDAQPPGTDHLGTEPGANMDLSPAPYQPGPDETLTLNPPGTNPPIVGSPETTINPFNPDDNDNPVTGTGVYTLPGTETGTSLAITETGTTPPPEETPALIGLSTEGLSGGGEVRLVYAPDQKGLFE